MAMMAVVGGKLSWFLLPPLKTSLVSARYACSKDKARAKMPHEGSRPVMPLMGIRGKPYTNFRTLWVGAVRLQGLIPLKSNTPPSASTP